MFSLRMAKFRTPGLVTVGCRPGRAAAGKPALLRDCGNIARPRHGSGLRETRAYRVCPQVAAKVPAAIGRHHFPVGLQYQTSTTPQPS
jgi:hypothetical protein